MKVVYLLIFYFRARAGSVIGLACNLTSLLSILIHPFMPDVSAEIRKQLQVLYSHICCEI
jgi:methionyl-tRNA synthetase